MTAIAIDGPAGAGKTTVARALATRLGWTYIDTGALYRAVALAALRRKVDLEDEAALAELARALQIEQDGHLLRVDGDDVTAAIRAPEVSRASSLVSRQPAVRAALLERQRRAAVAGQVVMEGRDIGTVVLPEAPLKVFLTASLDERAHRRALDLGVRESDAELEQLRESIEHRDESDRERTNSPLIQASDAVVIDSTRRSVEDIVDEIAGLVRQRLGVS